MAKKGRRATNEERLRAVQLLERGYSADEVAVILQVGRSSVFAWQAMYRAGGLAALSTKFASGGPTTLSNEQMVQLISGAAADGGTDFEKVGHVAAAAPVSGLPARSRAGVADRP